MILESCFKVEEGELDATTLPTGSGSVYMPFFCKKCGTYIYCEYERVPGVMLIKTSSWMKLKTSRLKHMSLPNLKWIGSV